MPLICCSCLRWCPLGPGRWTNPITGWTSSGDPLTSVQLTFDTKEQAIAFVEKKGMAFKVEENPPRMREYGKNYYAHNFLPPAVEEVLKREKTSTKYFDNPKANESHYVRPLK